MLAKNTARLIAIKIKMLCQKLYKILLSASITGRPGLVLCLATIASTFLPTRYKLRNSAFSLDNLITIVLTVFLVIIVALFTAAIQKNKSEFNLSLRVFYITVPVIMTIIFVSVFIRNSHNIRLAKEFNGKYMSVCGTVETMTTNAGRQDYKSDSSNDWTSIDFKTDNGMRIRVAGPADKLLYKNRIRITGLFVRPEKETNPGCFSYYDFLASKGIYLTCSLSEREKIELLEEPGFWQPEYWSYSVREKFGNSLEEKLGETENNLLKSLVLGDDSRLDKKLKIQFRRAGLSHLTAVSGTHVAFLQIPAVAMATLFSFSRNKKAVLMSGILLVYGCVTGWQIGTLRAVFMAISVLWTRIRNRTSDSLNTLGFAGSIIVMLDYKSVMQTGFWLSFSAATALFMFTGKFAIWLEESISRKCPVSVKSKLMAGFCRTLSAVLVIQVVLTPISSTMNGEVFLLSWLINIPAMMLAALICTIAIISWPLISVLNLINVVTDSEPIYIILNILKSISAKSLYVPIKLMKVLAEKSSLIKFGRIPSDTINNFIWIGLCITAIWFWRRFVLPTCKRKELSPLSCRSPDRISLSKFEKNKANSERSIILCGLVFLTAGIILLAGNAVSRPDWKIYFLDVGQGDAILMHHKSGKTVLIDGGPSDSGYYVILPVMTSLGIDRIDLAILTHGHEDHAAGLIELCDLGLIRSIVFNLTAKHYLASLGESNDNECDSMLYSLNDREKNNSFVTRDITAELLAATQKKSVKTEFLAMGDKIFLEDAEFDVLSPHRNMTYEQSLKDANSTSVVLSFKWQSYNILFLADLSGKIEVELNDQWQKADIIKIAHHGSRFTTQNEFLMITRPELAIISVGNNNYGHPSAELIERIDNFKIRTLRTDKDGCVLVSVDRKGLFAFGYKSSE